MTGVCLSTGRGVSQRALQISRPTPRGEVEGSGQGVSPGPHLEGEAADPHLGGVPGPNPVGCVCIPACTEADAPRMATAVGGTLPTVMHSCLIDKFM